MLKKKMVGLRIKELRKRQGLSQEGLAEKVDTSANYLSRMERGTENPTLDMLIKIADGLRVEMWELFDFGHERGAGELKEMLKRFGNELPEEKLRLAVKIIRSVAR